MTFRPAWRPLFRRVARQPDAAPPQSLPLASAPLELIDHGNGRFTARAGDQSVTWRDGKSARNGKDAPMPELIDHHDGSFSLLVGEQAVHWANGADGRDGEDGQDGHDGDPGKPAPLPVLTDHDNGAFSLSSGGKTVHWRSGVDGKNGRTPTLRRHRDGTATLSLDGESVTWGPGRDAPLPIVKDHSDGSYSLSVGDQTVSWRDGRKGKDGLNGKNGATPTVVDNGDGSYTLSVGDESVTWYDGADGAAGWSLIDQTKQLQATSRSLNTTYQAPADQAVFVNLSLVLHTEMGPNESVSFAISAHVDESAQQIVNESNVVQDSIESVGPVGSLPFFGVELGELTALFAFWVPPGHFYHIETSVAGDPEATITARRWTETQFG